MGKIIIKNGVRGSVFETVKPDHKKGFLVVFEGGFYQVGIIYLSLDKSHFTHWTYVMDKTRFDIDTSLLATACSILIDFGFNANMPPGFSADGKADYDSEYWVNGEPDYTRHY